MGVSHVLAQPSFEVASIRRNMAGFAADTSCVEGGRYRASNMTLDQLLRDAYRRRACCRSSLVANRQLRGPQNSSPDDCTFTPPAIVLRDVSRTRSGQMASKLVTVSLPEREFEWLNEFVATLEDAGHGRRRSAVVRLALAELRRSISQESTDEAVKSWLRRGPA